MRRSLFLTRFPYGVALFPSMSVCDYLVMIQIMESLGVLHELREAGAVDGDRVLVGEHEIVLAEPPDNLG